MTGSIKARGGFHEVLKHVEHLLEAARWIGPGMDYDADPCGIRRRGASSKHTGVSVASTGNLGFSIGLIARAAGLSATVHM